MPQVVVAPGTTTTNYQGVATIRNAQTGARSYGTYNGQATTTPANAFATGFANGMNMGAAIAAKRAQEDIHKSCMFAKGWSDTPPVATAAPAAAKLVVVAPKPAAIGLSANVKVYANAADEWSADADEFLLIYPTYRSGDMFERLNAHVKRTAVASPHLSGPQILLAARAALAVEGITEPNDTNLALARSVYVDAAAGKGLDQAALALLYAQGNGPAFPVNATRSAFWAQKSALGGHPQGQLGFGILRFGGSGVPEDKLDGYRWAKKASLVEASAQITLKEMEAQMTPDELRAVK